MKLLILTQKVDKNDDVLGFFHGWIKMFAQNVEKITVICLEKGEYDLPENVKVLSLGKEKGASKLRYIINFYKYIWRYKAQYSHVFVHMNQEYVLLAGLWWRFMGKTIFLWRNHAKGAILTRVAVILSHKVFYTSSQSYTARFRKALIMPVGIDTDFFKPDSTVAKKPNSILFLGRIAPIKNVDVFVEALNELQKRGVEFTATIAGASLSYDASYEKMIREKVIKYKLESKVHFAGAVNQLGALDLYRKHQIYVNLTPAGSMDKTIFEAMACKLTPVVSNFDLGTVLGHEFLIKNLDIKDLAKKIKGALENRTETDLRKFVTENHSLSKLISNLKNNE